MGEGLLPGWLPVFSGGYGGILSISYRCEIKIHFPYNGDVYFFCAIIYMCHIGEIKAHPKFLGGNYL